jgi:glucosamine-6-phosphate deaminase
MVALSIHATAEAAAATAAGHVIAALRERPELVLGLATGNTMRAFHAALARLHRSEGVSFAKATIFNLDDQVGVASDHPQCFRRFMRETLFDLIDAPATRCFMPDGTAQDLEAEAAAYEARIASAGGIDIQILGLGRNGHIAYNEPGSPQNSRTRVVALAPETIALAAPAFAPENPPRRGLTVGIGTILEARRIILIAHGADKAPAVARATSPPPWADCPASALQRHPDVLFCLDEAAATHAPRG